MGISGLVPTAGLSLRTPGQQASLAAVFPPHSVDRQHERNARPVEPPDDTERPRNEKDGRRELSDEERRELEDLKLRDRRVRASEAAQLGAAGRHARGGPRFQTQKGADGRTYAVRGEVAFDTAEIPDDPQATARKMVQVRRAVLADQELSPEERAVAAEATQKLILARLEIARERQEQARPAGGEDGDEVALRLIGQQLAERFGADVEGSPTPASGEVIDLRV